MNCSWSEEKAVRFFFFWFLFLFFFIYSILKQQTVFIRSQEVHDAAVKAAYVIANEIASASKLYSYRACVKIGMQKAAEFVGPE